MKQDSGDSLKRLIDVEATRAARALARRTVLARMCELAASRCFSGAGGVLSVRGDVVTLTLVLDDVVRGLGFAIDPISGDARFDRISAPDPLTFPGVDCDAPAVGFLEVGLVQCQVAVPDPAPEDVAAVEPVPEVEPEPDRSRTGAGPEPVPGAEPARTAPRTGAPWSAAELAQAREMIAKGHTPSMIAAQVGRPYEATRKKIGDLRREMGVQRGARGAEPVTPVAAPVQPVASPARPVAPDSGLTSNQRRIAMELHGLGHVAPWTPALDLDLCERLWRGDKLPAIAADLGLDTEAAKNRFRHLRDIAADDANGLSLAMQADLLVVLRNAAAAVAA